MNNQMRYTLRSSWTWVCTSYGYSWPKLNLSVYLNWSLMSQAEPEWVAHLVGTHSGSAWVMNNQMRYTLRFSLSHEWPNEAEPECVPHMVIHDPSWTWVCTSFGHSWLKLNLSVYLIWLFMTQAEPECVPHLVLESWITKWCTHSGSAWVMNNQMMYTLRFSLGHE
jgi:hypothetical protein